MPLSNVAPSAAVLRKFFPSSMSMRINSSLSALSAATALSPATLLKRPERLGINAITSINLAPAPTRGGRFFYSPHVIIWGYRNNVPHILNFAGTDMGKRM